MALLAKSKGEVTYKEISSLHKWALIVLISMGSSIIYTPMYLKGVFYDPLMTALGCSNTDLGAMVSMYGITALICYLPSGIVADKFRMRPLATIGFIATAVFVFIYATLPSVEICYGLFVLMGISSILVWWGTRFKVIRLCCEADEYPAKIGVSYTIYGATGLILGLVNAAVVAALVEPVMGVQGMLVFQGSLITVLGIVSYLIIPDFKGEINKESKLFSLADVVEAVRYPGILWAVVGYFCVYAVYQGATYTTPYLSQAFGADGNLVNVIGLIRTYGIALVAGPVVGWLATRLKSSSKVIVGCFILAVGVLLAFILVPQDAALTALVAALVVVFGFFTYGAFSIGSSPLSEMGIPMRIFGTATGVMSVIGFLPDVFIHTWYGSLIDASGNGAFPQIFGFEIMFAAIGVVALLLAMRSLKRGQAKRDAIDAEVGQGEWE